MRVGAWVFPREKIGMQGTWPHALGTFFAPIFLIFVMRWFFFEPFVIPSESMLPNLMVHDHIFVKKFSYGIKSPIGDSWIWKWSKPERGDVIVFRYPENREVFYIKRLIGLPGDKITVRAGRISVNGQPLLLTPNNEPREDELAYFNESVRPQQNDFKTHVVRFFSSDVENDATTGPAEKVYVVPPHSYFAMGDNRDQSHDSRAWGFIPEDLLVGKASLIWLSCSKTLDSAPFLCNPTKLRTGRLMKLVQ